MRIADPAGCRGNAFARREFHNNSVKIMYVIAGLWKPFHAEKSYLPFLASSSEILHGINWTDFGKQRLELNNAKQTSPLLSSIGSLDPGHS
jgi:hypothetical protein